MKNQKFFFSVVAVLFVLGVLVLFFFGFNSRVFAHAGTVNLVGDQEQVAMVNGIVKPDVVIGEVVASIPDIEEKVDVNVLEPVTTEGLVEKVPAQSTVVKIVGVGAVNEIGAVANDVVGAGTVEIPSQAQVLSGVVYAVPNAVEMLQQNILM